MSNIIWHGSADDVEDFVRLRSIASRDLFAALFGEDGSRALVGVFSRTGNLFSYEHAYFVTVDGQIAGMIFGYDWQDKKKESLKTGWLMLRFLGWNLLSKAVLFFRTFRAVGAIGKREYYVSSLAVYPNFRHLGIATLLLIAVEREARKRGNQKISLDVEVDNYKAIDLYRKRGYKITGQTDLLLGQNRTLKFFRMTKPLAD